MTHKNTYLKSEEYKIMLVPAILSPFLTAIVAITLLAQSSTLSPLFTLIALLFTVLTAAISIVTITLLSRLINRLTVNYTNSFQDGTLQASTDESSKTYWPEPDVWESEGGF